MGKTDKVPGPNLGCIVLALACSLSASVSMADEIPIAQRPLILGDATVPGNLFLVPSIEWPTMNSVANIGGFNPDQAYVGYFNARKCYVYQYDDTPEERHWAPSSAATAGRCSGTDEWSGNFLNWAATQTIDPFRLGLMGGYRFKDTPEATWLQKARHDGQGNQYPDRSVTGADVIAGATPFTGANRIDIRIDGLGGASLDGDRVTSPMRFWLNGSGNRNAPDGHYDPENSKPADIIAGGALDAEVRVAVCTGEVFIDEDRCREYPNGNYKPEGLIQEFARLDNEDGVLRYSLFTYLNDNNTERDGGVMRSAKKFVGPEMIDPDTGEPMPNPNAEWDANTGVLVKNPDPDVAADTSTHYGVDIDRSGILNYLGSSGQTNTNTYKSIDPISELYYAASRYLRDLGPVQAYHTLPGNTGANVQRALDDFPVVREWDDPLETYFCAPNAGISIADVFTHRDKNLPGNENTARGNEPAFWSELADDAAATGLDVRTRTNQIGDLEGIGGIGNSVFTGRQNSAYIAGLAYEMHTRDQRPDLQGTQTMSSYMVDVVENQNLVNESNNMLYLAAKYGGFNVPPGFDPDTRDDPLETNWWNTGGEGVSAGGSSYDLRPDNYFVANEASRMVEGLRDAFEKIVAEESGSSAAVAANTTEASSDTLLYQAQFEAGTWRGEILAIGIDDDGAVQVGDVAWQASEGIPAPGTRNVYTIDDGGNLSNVQMDTGRPLGLTDDQWEALEEDGDLADYLLFGVTDDEVRNGGDFRDRADTVLGDIVNSAPFVTTGGNFGYSVLPEGGSDYRDFLADKRDQDEMLYVGANDGMLHAFNATADGGDEVFAFLPDSVFETLPDLANPAYDHRNYVDGHVEVADAYWDGDWGQALVASTGGGPPAVFGLDVTSGGLDDVLWELTPDDDDQLGHVMDEINIVRMNNGEFAAVFGNGYNSGEHEASLFIVPLDNPENRIVIETGEGSEDNPNGLGGVATVDLQGNGVIDRIYAGDLHGNMWRFDVSDGSSSGWDAELLFEARGPNGEVQPITAAPRATPHSQSGIEMNVLFGTGQYFAEGDDVVASNPDVQSFYALKDDGSGTVERSNLVEQSIVEQSLTSEPPSRTLSDESVSAGDDGWHIDLWFNNMAEGERVVDRAALVGDRVFFLTQIPEGEVCGFGGRSWLMEMNAESGGLTPTELVEGNPDIGGLGFDQLATGLSGLRGDGSVIFYPSLADGSVEEVEVPDPGSARTGRQSWQELR